MTEASSRVPLHRCSGMYTQMYTWVLAWMCTHTHVPECSWESACSSPDYLPETVGPQRSPEPTSRSLKNEHGGVYQDCVPGPLPILLTVGSL